VARIWVFVPPVPLKKSESRRGTSRPKDSDGGCLPKGLPKFFGVTLLCLPGEGLRLICELNIRQLGLVHHGGETWGDLLATAVPTEFEELRRDKATVQKDGTSRAKKSFLKERTGK